MSDPKAPAIEAQHAHLASVAEMLYRDGRVENWHVASIDHEHIDASRTGGADSILMETRMTIMASNAGTKGIQYFDAVCRGGHCYVEHIDCGEA